MGSENDRRSENKVLTLAGLPRPSARMDRIENYWNTVRGKRLVPSRCEIDPRGLDGVLRHAFILERISGGLARFRIAGSHLSDVSGLELRQMPLSVLFEPGSRELLSDALTAVFDDPSVVRMSIASPAGFGREALTGEVVLLPLRSDLGDIDRVLGGLVLDGSIGRTPRRIEITGQTRRSLTGFAGPLHSEAERVPEPPTPASRQTTPPRRRPVSRGHLTLVVSNH